MSQRNLTTNSCSTAFVHHPAIEVCSNIQSPGMVVAGRTGSGKTAVLRYVDHVAEHSVHIDPTEMSLSYVSNSDTLRFVQAIGRDLDLLFLALWKHVLCIEFIRLRYKVHDEQKSKTIFSRIVERFRGDARKQKSLKYLREWDGKFWITMDQNIRDITERYEISCTLRWVLRYISLRHAASMRSNSAQRKNLSWWPEPEK